MLYIYLLDSKYRGWIPVTMKIDRFPMFREPLILLSYIEVV